MRDRSQSTEWEHGYVRDGFVVLPNVFTSNELATCRGEILNHAKGRTNASIVDFVGRGILPCTEALKDSPALQRALRRLFGGSNFRYCSHNDVGISRCVGWHKDTLKNPAYEQLDVFDSSQHIVKVAVYLQDHSSTDDGLCVVPGSHRSRAIATEENNITLHPPLGSCVIFDQRITHRGAASGRRDGAKILVSFGFGVNNQHTDQFERGTIARQQTQLCQRRPGIIL